ncbi:MAG: hypothetical protein AAGG09_15250 [Pseudomonadota bacterium]
MTTHVSPARPVEILSVLRLPFDAVVWFFTMLARAQSTAQCYEHLSTLSDETLAEQGLTREELPAAAFRKHFEA